MGQAAGGSTGGGGRRDFFTEALHNALEPLSGVVERQIEPLLAALERLPGEVERALPAEFRGPLDQPQAQGGGVPVDPPAYVEPRYLRPPGAGWSGEPGSFEAACQRCGKCVEACPAHAIKLDENGLVAEGAPYILAREQPCVVCDSLACMLACPSGALQVLDKWAIRMGMAKVDHEACLRGHGEDCRKCVEACPLGERALVVNARTGRVVVKLKGCIGCGVCEQVCPAEGEGAIVVRPNEGRRAGEVW